MTGGGACLICGLIMTDKIAELEAIISILRKLLARARGLIESNARAHGYTHEIEAWIEDYLKVRVRQ
jgi:hypothetical protein